MESLEPRLVLAASPWQNPARPLDVNNDGHVTALDALLVVNQLGQHDASAAVERTNQLAPYFDVSGDERFSPVDALSVINALNRADGEEIYSSSRLEGQSEVAPAGFVSAFFGMLPGVAAEKVELNASMTVGSQEFNELGLFVVETEDGHVNGIAPGTPGYADAVFASPLRQVVYSKRDVFQTERIVTFRGGQRLGIYVLQPAANIGESAAHLRVIGSEPDSISIRWEQNAIASWVDLDDTRYDDARVDVHISEPFTQNSAPNISAIGNRQIATSTPVLINVPATDPDIDQGDQLTYSVVFGPDGAQIDSETGTLSWTPSQPGEYSITVAALDAFGGFDQAEFVITVWPSTWLLGNRVGTAAATDTWASNLVVNKSDVYTNLTGSIQQLEVGDFSFTAADHGGPVTPFLVRMDGDEEFSLLSIGKTRWRFELGINTVSFSGGAAESLTLLPGETIAAGFLDAFASGAGGDNRGTVAFNPGGDEIWHTGGPHLEDSASLLGRLNRPLQPGAVSRTEFRNYHFSVELIDEALRDVSVSNGGFEHTTSAVAATTTPDGWHPVGEGTIAVETQTRGRFVSIAQGAQSLSMNGNVWLTTSVPVATIKPGTYEFSAALGNRFGRAADQEPGTYVLRFGYGDGGDDFTQVASHVVDGTGIPNGQWVDHSIEFTFSDSHMAVGQGLMLQVEHLAFSAADYHRQQGDIDDVRLVFTEASPILELPSWPTEPGEAVVSNKYRAWATQDGVRREVTVLMSNSLDYGTNPPTATHGRTFSWVALASNYAEDVTIEIQKIYGDGAPTVEILPSGYGIDHTLSADGRVATFTLNQSRYVSVNFQVADNKKTANGMIENMLMVFADPLEEQRPSPGNTGVLVFNERTTQAEIDAAETVYIPRGFYRLSDIVGTPDLYLQSGQSLYLEPGAFVLGRIQSRGPHDDIKLFGRGAISGRDLVWQVDPKPMVSLNGANNTVTGLFVFDGHHHGVVPGWQADLRNLKLWGWHYNNDGFRPWGGTVQHSFLRPVDDAFYVAAQPLTVDDVVVWQGVNGGVVTYGWEDYGQSGFVMMDSHVINPEWGVLRNNNGLLMSQSPSTVEQLDVRFRNITIDGNVPGITNIKLGSRFQATVSPDAIGRLDGLMFENVTVNGAFLKQTHKYDAYQPSKSVLQGAILNDGENVFLVSNVTFKDLLVDGQYVTEENKAAFFDIDLATTSNISFIVTPERTQQG